MAIDFRTPDTGLVADDFQTAFRRTSVTSVEIERRASLSPVEDAEVNLHCADLEACLASLSARQSPVRTEFCSETVEMLRERLGRGVPDLASRFNVVETNFKEDARVIELHNINVVPRVQVQEIIRSKPVVEIQQQVRTVPRFEVKEVERVVEVPHTHYVNKLVEVPEVRIVEKVVEVPQVCIQEVVKEVPRIQIHEVIRHVPRVEVREILRPVPKVEVKYVEKFIEVPRIQTVEKIVEVPQVQTVEKIVQVPQVQTIEKIVPVEKIIQVEKPVLIPTTTVPEKIEVLERVIINGTQVPLMSEILLMSMTPTKLREHAFLLYNTFGQSGNVSAPPVAQAELVRWVMNIQRQHVEPFRAKAPPPAGYPPLGPRASVTSTMTTNVPCLTPRATSSNVQCLTPRATPSMAVAGVDTTHDGVPNFLFVGADTTGNGIPDTLQSPTNSRNGGSITTRTPRQVPERIVGGTLANGRPQRAVTIGATSEMSGGLNSLGVTQIIGGTTTLASPAVMSSGSVSPTLGVTLPGRTSINQTPHIGSITAPIGTPQTEVRARSITAPIGTPRTEVRARSQTSGPYYSAVAPVRSSSQLSKSGSSSAVLSNGLLNL